LIVLPNGRYQLTQAIKPTMVIRSSDLDNRLSSCGKPCCLGSAAYLCWTKPLCGRKKSKI